MTGEMWRAPPIEARGDARSAAGSRGRAVLAGILGPPAVGPQRVGMRHGDDVIAGIDKMDFAGDAGREVGQQIKPGAAEILQRHAAMQR